MSTHPLPLTASASDLQRKSREILKKVQADETPVLILKNNKTEAVLLSPRLYTEMSEKVEKFEEFLAKEAIQHYSAEKKDKKLKKLNTVEELFET
ncbi:MAG: type II toxin-antitoxin system Phd/YefM family antitoxin [Candidatus Roizmanbacteria bacterium]